MARIKGVTKEQAAPDLRPIFEEQERIYGEPLNTTSIYALRPTILHGSRALAAGIDASKLIEPSLKYLVTTRTALINGCPF
jgi:hypothetical protein